ncbi:MAG: hypothetical protein JOZ29_17830, partial [Deltaproteobacteria bacterium]|nr:hypothetical protein [Deltaproteobacteria bacterium]
AIDTHARTRLVRRRHAQAGSRRKPLLCQAFDECGVRLSLIDWTTGAESWDLYVPHDMIKNMLLATDQHFADHMAEEFGKWQGQVNRDQADNDDN